MPTFRNRTVLDLSKNIKAFLNLETGLTRSKAPQPSWAGGGAVEIERLKRELAAKNKKIAELGAGPEARLDKSSAGPGNGVSAENVVWIFGFGRSGTTWLSSMMGDLRGYAMWPEPMVGALFGEFYYADAPVRKAQRNSKWFIMGPQREAWLGLIRNFFLDGAKARFPKIGKSNFLVVKEPHSAVGAPLMMEALPESRMILLVRDPRDVMASASESLKKGSWGSDVLGIKKFSDFDAKAWSNLYLKSLTSARQAYEAHEGHKVLVRYEDLRANTLGTMKRIYSSLGIDVDGEELERVVEKHSWENIPSEKKGEGKFYRKATPGGWKEDLTSDEAETIERITAPVLEEFYS